MRHKPNFSIPQRPASQRGATLAIVVFIIVVMSILGLAMVRLLANAGQSTVSEVMGARAQAAARSGAEVVLTQLFPLNEGTNIEPCVERTDSLPTNIQFSTEYSIEGLQGCRVEATCDRLELPEPYGGYHFRIVSTGFCIAGNQTYSKQIVLEASEGVE